MGPAFGRRCILSGGVAPAPKMSRRRLLQRDFMAKFLEPSHEIAGQFVRRQTMKVVRAEVAILDSVTEQEIGGGQNAVRHGHRGALLAPSTGNALELRGEVTVLLPAGG